MKSTLRPTTTADLAAVRKFLARVFHSKEDSPALQPAVMAWKYWDRRDDWTEPRAYVLERDGAIVAHAGIYPVTFDSGKVRGIQMVDWASASDSPGAGLAMLQKLTGMFDFVYSIGGSEMTCKLLPAYGFVEYAQQWRGARPLRPFGLIATHQQRDWKLAPRLVRNFLWSRPGAHVPSGWEAEEIAAQDLDDAILSKSMEETHFSLRPHGFFEYLLRCPVMPVRLYGIRHQGGIVGHFVIGVLRGQARVGGVWLRIPNATTWQAAYTLAQTAAARLAGAYEIAAAGTQGASEEAAAQSGMRMLGHTPVYLLNKNGKLALPRAFQFQLGDDDVFFLDIGQPAYWT